MSKTFFLFATATIAVFMSGITMLAAQVVFPDHTFMGSDSEIASNLLQWYNYAMLALGYFITYVSSQIPILKRVNNLAWRAAIVSAVLGVIFYKMGAGGLGVAITFLTIINPYELALKPVIGATKTDDAPEMEEPVQDDEVI